MNEYYHWRGAGWYASIEEQGDLIVSYHLDGNPESCWTAERHGTISDVARRQGLGTPHWEDVEPTVQKWLTPLKETLDKFSKGIKGEELEESIANGRVRANKDRTALYIHDMYRVFWDRRFAEGEQIEARVPSIDGDIRWQPVTFVRYETEHLIGFGDVKHYIVLDRRGRETKAAEVRKIDLYAVMTAGEAAVTFGLSESAVRKAIERNQMPARKSGGTWLIRRADAEARWDKRK